MITSETTFLDLVITFVQLFGVYGTIKKIKNWCITEEPTVDEMNDFKDSEMANAICELSNQFTKKEKQ